MADAKPVKVNQESGGGPVDPKERQAILTSVEGTEQSPSTRTQTSFVNWKALGERLGQPFDAETIPYSKLRQMRRDPMIAFGLHYVKTPLVRAPWRIEADGDAQVAAFVDYALRQIYPRYIFQRSLALDFGASPMVKRFELGIPKATFRDPNNPDAEEEQPVWSEGTVEAVLWKSFVALRPERSEPAWDEDTGEFIGIKNEDARVGTAAGQSSDQNKPDVDIYHALWATNERDSVFGSLWGYPRVGYAYRYWWSYWFRWALSDRYFERTAVPPVTIHHPDGSYTDEETGEKIAYRDIAAEAASRARANGIITLPSEVVETLDEKSSNLRQWEIAYLEGGEPKVNFDESFDYLDVMKLRSMWVPEQAFIEGEGGTSSRNVAAQMAEIFIQSQSNLMEEIDDEINRFMIPQLVAVNFPEFEGRVRKVTTGFAQEDVDFIKQLIQLVGQDDWRSLGLDIRQAMERAGLPTLSPAQQAAEQQKLLDQAAAATVVAPVEPTAGEVGVVPAEPAAGTGTSTGFSYIQGKESIMLSDDADLMAALPSSRHFSDEESRKLAVRLQKLYKQDYAERVKDLARHIAELDELPLAEPDPNDLTAGDVAAAGLTAVAAKQLADGIVNTWTWPQEKLAQLAEATANLYGKIFSFALSAEADATGFTGKPDQEAVDAWVESHSQETTTSTHESLKDEMRSAIAAAAEGKEPDPVALAEELKEHFSERPSSKSESLAVTETVSAYNTATLMLGEANDVQQAQAVDAQKGPTDKDCEDRNSKIFNLSDAKKEDAKERHPRCTLEWRLLRPEIALSRVTYDLPPDTVAVFDDDTNTVYMSENISRPEEKRYLLALGASLAA